MQHRPGRNNGNADSLSRQYSDQAAQHEGLDQHTRSAPNIQHDPEGPEVVTQQQIGVIPSRSKAELATLQSADPILKVFLSFWGTEKPPNKEQRLQLPKDVKHLLQQWDRILEKDGLLYKQATAPHGESYTLLFLPTCLRRELLNNLHNKHGHQGVRRTTDLT